MAISVGEIEATLTLKDQLTSALRSAQQQLEQFGPEVKRVGDSMSQFGKDFAAASLAAGAGLAGVIMAAGDFESSFAGVKKTVGDAVDEFGNLTPVGKELEQGFRDLAKTIPLSVNEFNRIGEAAGQLGIETPNILKFSETMAALGVTTNLSSDQAATSLARLANITGMQQQDFDRLGSTIVDLGNNFATTEAEITEMALRLSKAGETVGLTEAEILAFSAALSSVGIEAEAGGSAIQRLLMDMAMSAEQGGEKLEKFSKIAGVDFKQAFEQDAAGALQAFIVGLKDTERHGMSTLGALDSLGISEVRLQSAVLGLANASDVMNSSLEVAKKAWQENTALTKEAEQRYNTFYSQLTIFWNRLQDVAIEIGSALLPALKDMLTAAEPVLDWVASAAKGFADLPTPLQLSAAGILALTAAAAPAAIVLGQLANAYVALSVALSSKAVLDATLWLTSFLTPINAVAAGIVALAVAWATFKDDWTRAFDVIIPPLGMFRTAWDELQQVLSPFSGWLSDIASIVGSALVIAFELAKDVFGAVKDMAVALADAVQDRLYKELALLLSLADKLVPGIGLVATAFMTLRQNADEMAKVLKQTVLTAITEIIAVIDRVVPGFMTLATLAAALTWDSEDLADRMKKVADQMRGADLEARNLGGQFLPLASGMRETSDAAGGAARASADLTAQLDAVRAEVAALTDEQKANIAAGAELKLSTEAIAKAAEASEAAVEMYKDQLKELERKSKDAKKAQDEFEKSVSRSWDTFVELKPAIKDYTAELQNLMAGLDASGNVLSRTLEETGRATEEADRQTREWANTHGAVLMPALKDSREEIQAVRDKTEEWRGSLDEIARAMSQMANVAGGSFGGIMQSMAGLVTGLDAQAKATDAMKEGFSNLNTEGSSLIGSLMQIASGAIASASAFMQAVTSGDTFSRTLGGITQGAQMGSMFGPIGTAIGAVAGGIVGLISGLTGVSEEVKKARQEIDKFQDDLNATATETQRAEAALSGWADTGALTLIQVRDALTLIGRSGAEADALVKQLWDTDHPDRARRAMEEINRVLEQSKKHLSEGRDLFDEMMSAASETGASVPPQLAGMVEQMAQLGIITADDVEKFRALGEEAVPSVQEIEAAAESLGMDLNALGPKVEGARLTDQFGAIFQSIETVRKGTGDLGMALFGAKEEVSKLVVESMRIGAEIPLNMKPYIEELMRSGLLVDENGQALTDLSQLNFGDPIVSALDKIVTRFEEFLLRISGADLGLAEVGAEGARAAGQIESEFRGRAIPAVEDLGDAIDSTIRMDSPTGLEGIAYYATLAGDAMDDMAAIGIAGCDGLIGKINAVAVEWTDGVAPAVDAVLIEWTDSIDAVGLSLDGLLGKMSFVPGVGVPGSDPGGGGDPDSDMGAIALISEAEAIQRATQLFAEYGFQITQAELDLLGAAFGYTGSGYLNEDLAMQFLAELENLYLSGIIPDLADLPSFRIGTEGFVDFGAGKTVRLHGREAVVPEDRAIEFALSTLGAERGPSREDSSLSKQMMLLRADMERWNARIVPLLQSAVRDTILLQGRRRR